MQETISFSSELGQEITEKHYHEKIEHVFLKTDKYNNNNNKTTTQSSLSSPYLPVAVSLSAVSDF